MVGGWLVSVSFVYVGLRCVPSLPCGSSAHSRWGARVAREHRVGWGAPAQHIGQGAKEGGGGLIVLGHHGGGLRSLLLGSVARQVIDEAECSVLVVR